MAKQPHTFRHRRVVEDLAVEELLRRIRPRLLRVLARFRIPPQDAEDLLQETFVILVTKWDTIRNREAWLLVTLNNRCIMYWRRQRSRLCDAVDAAILELIAEPESPGQEDASLRVDLDHLLSRISERCRTLLRLRYGLGHTSAETADQTGYCASSVRKITRRCLVELGRHLTAEGFE